MAQHYSDPKRAGDAYALPNIETFQAVPGECDRCTSGMALDGPGDERHCDSCATGTVKATGEPAGWYWWACFPGCLPDSDPSRPFATEAEALADAREGSDDDGE